MSLCSLTTAGQSSLLSYEELVSFCGGNEAEAALAKWIAYRGLDLAELSDTGCSNYFAKYTNAHSAACG